MVSVEIPNDIVEYKPKLVLGLTGRQVALVIMTAGFILLDFMFLKPYIGDTGAIFVAAIPAFFAAMFGWGEKFTPGNVLFEKYLKTVFVQSFVAPKLRKCKTITSSMVVPCDKYYEPIPDEALPEEVLECVNYVREHIYSDTLEGEEGVDANAQHLTKKVKKKYVKSKLAML